MNQALQEWMDELSVKKQTVMLMALRGPDVGMSKELKPLIRFIRSIVLINADPTKNFMQNVDFMTIKEMEHQNPAVIDALPGHVIHHLCLALQVIGYDHPDTDIRTKALSTYKDIGHVLALVPMNEKQYRSRLRDNIRAIKVA